MVAPVTPPDPKPALGRTALTWCLVGIFALGLSLGTRFFRPTVRGLEVAGQIVDDSCEYQQQIKKNEALAAEVAYLQTEQGLEAAVYKNMGKVKPGQHAGQVVLEPAPPAPSPPRPKRVGNWISRARTCSADALHWTGQVLLCYWRLRPLDRPPKASNEGPPPLSKGTT